MQDGPENRKHARGSYLSLDELRDGKQNMVREFRSIRELPIETTSKQEAIKSFSPVSIQVTENKEK